MEENNYTDKLLARFKQVRECIENDDLDGAMELLKEQERTCRFVNDQENLQRILGSQALILKERGEFDGAWELLKEQERICRERGDLIGMAKSLALQEPLPGTKNHPKGFSLLWPGAIIKDAPDSITIMVEQVEEAMDYIRKQKK